MDKVVEEFNSFSNEEIKTLIATSEVDSLATGELEYTSDYQGVTIINPSGTTVIIKL